MEITPELRLAASSACFEVVFAVHSNSSYNFFSSSSKSRRRVSLAEEDGKWGVAVVNTARSSGLKWFALNDIKMLQRRTNDTRCLILRLLNEEDEAWQFKSGCEREVFCAWLLVLGCNCILEPDAEYAVTRLPQGSFSIRAETCSNIIGQLTETTVVVVANGGNASELRFEGKAVGLDELQFIPSNTNGRRLDLSWISFDQTGWSSASIERAISSSGKKNTIMSRTGGSSTDFMSSLSNTRRVTLYLASSVARESFLARCRQLKSSNNRITSDKSIRVLCATMNTGDGKPPQPSHKLDSWLPTGEADVYAIGFQENSEKRKWLKAIEHHLCVSDEIEQNESRSLCEERLKARGLFGAKEETLKGPLYTLVASSTLWDIHILLFLRRDIRLVTPVATATEATGFGHILGNKGAAAVAVTLSTSDNAYISLMFVSSHLAARATRLGHRQSNYEEIVSGLRLSAAVHPSLRNLQVVHQFDAVFWMGDLNYRIDCGNHGNDSEFQNCLELAYSGDFSSLLAYDQLRSERDNHAAVFSLFHEPMGGPNFAPTYRLIKKKPTEYSNKKFQNPSYCDRVLVKTHNTTWLIPDDHFLDKEDFLRPISYQADFTEPMALSDHRPVRALFELNPKPLPIPSCDISGLDAVWISLEDVVFVLAPEVSPPGTDTFFRYDGYAGSLSLHLKAPFLLDKTDRASFGRDSLLSLTAACTAATLCESAKAQAHERLASDKKDKSTTKIKNSRLDNTASARIVWSATTPSWAWPHFSTPPLFSRITDINWLGHEKLAVVLNKYDISVYGGSDPCLGVAEISLELPSKRVSNKCPSNKETSLEQESNLRRPWDIAHAKYDDEIWTQDKEANRSRLFDALIDQDGAHYDGGDGGAAVFSSPVVRHGKWIGTLSGRVRICYLPDLAQVAPDNMLLHLAAWQQVAHVDAVVSQAYAAAETTNAAILDTQEPTAATVHNIDEEEEHHCDIPMDHDVAVEAKTAEQYVTEKDAESGDDDLTSIDKMRFTECEDIQDDDVNNNKQAVNIAPVISRRASDDPTTEANTAMVEQVFSAPSRLHSLNPKRDAKLRRDCSIFDRLYRGSSPALSNIDADDDDENEDDDEDGIKMNDGADDERVYLEKDEVVFEHQQQRIHIHEFRCVDTNKLLKDRDFAFGPSDGKPRTREAHLERFGEWLEAATLRPLKKTDDFIVACGGLKWMPFFFRCAKTGIRLSPSTPFYEFEQRPYCEEAYREMFFTCHLCHEATAFDGNDAVRALGESWHRHCFRCAGGSECPCSGVLKDDVAWGHDAQDGHGIMPYCQVCYRNKFTRRCPSCGESVLPGVDKYVKACDELWHADHFRCAATGESLVDKPYYEHEGLPYTLETYFEKFGECCEQCGEIIRGNDIVRAAGHCWHPEHFVCRASGRKIPRNAAGDFEFYVGDDGEVYDAESYAERFASSCFMCGESIGGLADRRDLGPPQIPPVEGGTGGVRQQSLLMVPDDRPVSYHPECFKCVVTGTQLEPDTCYLGDDDGLPYCLEAYEAKCKSCFLTDKKLGDSHAILNALGLVFSERAYRSTHTDDWCAGCLLPLIAAENAGTDPRWGLKWHPACAKEHSPNALSEDQAKSKRGAITAAKRTASQELQSRIDAYQLSQRALLDRARDRCRSQRNHKEKISPNIEDGDKPQIILPKQSPPQPTLPESSSISEEEDSVVNNEKIQEGAPSSPDEDMNISREKDTLPPKPSTAPRIAPEDRAISVPSFVPPISDDEDADELDAVVERKTETSNPMVHARRASRLSSQAELVKVAANKQARGECFEGYLFKRGGGTSVFGRKNWLERYFVLAADSTLQYYRDKDSYLGGGRPLKDAAYQLSSCRVYTAKDKIKDLDHIIIEPMSCEAGARQLDLKASSPQEHDRWFEELKRRAARV